MHPLLFKIGPLSVRTYGLLMAAGFTLAIFMAAVRARKRGIDPDAVIDLGFYVILAGIIGARVFYVIQMPEYYMSRPLDILKVWEGGLVFYGGLIGAVIVSLLYMRIKGLSILSLGDLAVPSIALGQAVGRLGCFFAGCCYGLPFDGKWSVIFENPQSLAPRGISLHPVQLYMSAANFLIVLVLLAIDKRKRFEGQTFLSYFIIYPVSRFILELFRGDNRGNFFGTFLSPAQGTGAVMVLLAAAVWHILRKRRAALEK